jgi:hypothetical protein
MPAKRVHFGHPKDDATLGTVVCLIEQRTEYTPEEVGRMFFSRSDYHMTRSAARVVSKESERYGFSKTLQGTYGVEKSVE